MPHLNPDPQLRAALLDFFIGTSTSEGLSGWLRDIGQDSKGSVAEKQERIKAHTKYLGMPAEKFPEQTQNYMDGMDSDMLADLCEALGLSDEGTKDERYRRVMREVRFREGWLSRPDPAGAMTATLVSPFVEHYPILKRGEYEKDYYNAFESEMSEVFGDSNVHPQLAIAYGNSLKIDFHIGPANEAGVGVEWKLPTNNSELQKAIGQLDQYGARYGANLIVVLVPDFISEAQKQLFEAATKSRGIQLVVR